MRRRSNEEASCLRSVLFGQRDKAGAAGLLDVPGAGRRGGVRVVGLAWTMVCISLMLCSSRPGDRQGQRPQHANPGVQGDQRPERRVAAGRGAGAGRWSRSGEPSGPVRAVLPGGD